MGTSAVREGLHGSRGREGSYQPKPLGSVIQTNCGRCGAELGWSQQKSQTSTCQTVPVLVSSVWRDSLHHKVGGLTQQKRRRLLTVPWIPRTSNQSSLKEINPEYSLERLMLKMKLQYFGYLMQRTNSLEKTLMLGKTEDRKQRGWQEMKWLNH